MEQAVNVKGDRFKRVALNRVNKAMRDIQRIGNLSGRARYDYTADEVDKIFKALRDELDVTEKKFNPVQTTFRWDQ